MSACFAHELPLQNWIVSKLSTDNFQNVWFNDGVRLITHEATAKNYWSWVENGKKQSSLNAGNSTTDNLMYHIAIGADAETCIKTMFLVSDNQFFQGNSTDCRSKNVAGLKMELDLRNSIFWLEDYGFRIIRFKSPKHPNRKPVLKPEVVLIIKKFRLISSSETLIDDYETSFGRHCMSINECHRIVRRTLFKIRIAQKRRWQMQKNFEFSSMFESMCFMMRDNVEIVKNKHESTNPDWVIENHFFDMISQDWRQREKLDSEIGPFRPPCSIDITNCSSHVSSKVNDSTSSSKSSKIDFPIETESSISTMRINIHPIVQKVYLRNARTQTDPRITKMKSFLTQPSQPKTTSKKKSIVFLTETEITKASFNGTMSNVALSCNNDIIFKNSDQLAIERIRHSIDQYLVDITKMANKPNVLPNKLAIFKADRQVQSDANCSNGISSNVVLQTGSKLNAAAAAVLNDDPVHSVTRPFGTTFTESAHNFTLIKNLPLSDGLTSRNQNGSLDHTVLESHMGRFESKRLMLNNFKLSDHLLSRCLNYLFDDS